MGLAELFNKHESLIALDIGSSSIKLVEIDTSGSKPKLLNIGISPVSSDVFSNNIISKMDSVSEQISSLLEVNSIEDRRVITAMPGPSVFTKKIKMPKLDMAELASNIQFEAGNFIPHSIDAVKLDFYVVGEVGKQLEVLVVAVKNEIIDSFVDCVALTGLETAVVDVDYFALQNIFELARPDLIDQTIVLINIGARYTSINICRGGQSLFTGDIAVGGKQFTDAIESELGIPAGEAELLKTGKAEDPEKQAKVKEVIDRSLEQVAAEFNRQLSFFWNASGAEDGIDRIILTGGGSRIEGLKEEFSEKTGLECEILDPFKGIDCSEGFDRGYLEEIGPVMSVALGLGIRQPGDKEAPE